MKSPALVLMPFFWVRYAASSREWLKPLLQLHSCPWSHQNNAIHWGHYNVGIKSCAVLSRLVVSDSLGPHGLQPARLLCPWGFSRQEYWSGLPCPPPGDLSKPGIEPRSPALQADFLPSEPPGNPMSTRVGSLSLLQGNLPDPGVKLRSPTLQVDTLPAKLPGKPGLRTIGVEILVVPLTSCGASY